MADYVEDRVPLLPVSGSGESKRHLGILSAVTLIINRIIGTGIFSIPSSIYQLTGSVGLTMLLWVLGGVFACCGFSVYLEYGLHMPQSGGEKNYLDHVYYWPPRLLLTIFSVSCIFLSFSASNSYAFGNYIQLALGHDPEEYTTRWIAILTVGLVCLLHGLFPHAGLSAFNSLGIIKVFMLVLIAGCGPLIAFGIIDVDGGETMRHNLGNSLWQNDGFGGSLYEISVSLMRVSYSYRGWETCNMVMGEVKNPRSTVARAGLIALATTTMLYFMCTFAYFSIIPKEEISDSGVIVAGIFLLKLFGESVAVRVLPLMICLSNLGNILVVTYASSRVIQEIGKHNILPGSRWLAAGTSSNSPIIGLGLHLLMTILILVLPPAGDVYNFVVDTSTYPVSVFAGLITAGLIAVHRNPEKWNWESVHSYTAPTVFISVFLMSNLIMIIFPWIPPPPHCNSGLPYYASPLAATCIFMIGFIYWLLRKDHILRQLPPYHDIN